MSRRDTIIIAILVNAGLLIVLFASALKSNALNEEFVVAPPPIIHETPGLALKKENAVAVGDEIDAALNRFTQNALVATPAAPIKSTVLPSSIEPAPANFADDIKAIAIPAAPLAPQEQAPKAQTLVAPLLPQTTPQPEFNEVKVKKGDVLEKIARQHHTTVAEIMKANKLANSHLRIGQVLKIPNKMIKKAEPSPVVFAPSSAPISNVLSERGTKYYTVKKGDNPWTIAVKNHLKVEDLLKLNNMNEEQARHLKPGDQLRIQ